MSPAFLMLTSAWLASADAAAPAPAVSSAPVVSTGSSCGGGCGTCADTCHDSCYKESFFSKLRGRFSRSHDCGCEAPTCNTCAPAPVVHHHHVPAPTCCAPAPVYVAPVHTCNTCNTCHDACDTCKPSLFDRLKARFKRNKCGCESACDTCGGCSTCGSTIAAPGAPVPAPAGEKVTTPPQPLPKTTSAIIDVPTRLGNEQEGPKVSF